MKLKPLHDNQEINDSVVQHPIITNLVNRDLSSLEKENFIIFPQQLNQSKDLSEDNLIFQSRNGKIWTCNVVGILSDSTDELRIHSRFANQMKHEDFFLRYMLQRVLNYNVINDHFSASKKMTYYDWLVFLFPYYLNEAMRKGIYKEYVKREYNNANIKGAVDVAKHIRSNVPFVGKVAYRTREFNYNNHLTQLIRHTIEKIQNEYDFLLSGDEDTKENVALIKQTTPGYARLNQFNILHPVKHSYYEEYSALQQICIQILSEEKSGFGSDKNQIHGIIIDVSWLWEE
ncbi:5-methylcytosine restriction system specificity protein McrC, partial [Enterococcus lactis]